MGTADENYVRFAKMGVPGYTLAKPVEPPEAMAHLMVWYMDIRARAPRGMGFEPVSLTEIEVYERHLGKVGIEMDALDFSLLCRLDGIWMSVQARSETSPQDDSPPEVRPAGDSARRPRSPAGG